MPSSDARPRHRSRLRAHAPWLVVALVVTVLAVGQHQTAIRGNPRAPGGTRAGLALGLAATSLVLFASLLGVRRRLLSLPVGAMAPWLRAHVWLGGLALVLALLHAGPRAGGPLGQALLALLALVSASGLVGSWIQHVIPGALDAVASDQPEARMSVAPGVRRWLHGWLLLHVPLSMALLVLLAVHLLAAFRY